ncbi:S1C family serine protease [Herbiconiux sp. KACC 21604]|uniref:S1C family serine protease n=1 Tax=unclassified Herbiconiux TaxID=2618217 RepID=UPI001490DE3D|nr:S1C family serine protease [Herbiconiux sp. SALV-R1]QJU55786.1 serine protease [Herbiconiux sp. SALV-R1]WPO86997.1 S1C family serine protease [Herbiconiux sp. KACC 21604]
MIRPLPTSDPRSSQPRSRTARPLRRGAAATAVGTLAVLALTACSFGFGGGPADRGGASGTAGPGVNAAGAVGFDEVQSAVLQIEAVGTFADPSYGDYEGAGRGTGFLISPDGLALTNNHVVVGAGTLDVWRGGDTAKTLNAQVVASSECLDLAVIQLQKGDYPYFAWHDGEIATATDVYAAGFPLGDPTFTMTRGIVSKASTPGETPWASLDSVIEHDARIRPGNSGGPLVDTEGRLMGVNYAGSDLYDTNLAIHRDEVQAVLDELEAGTDVLSLGINAHALTDDEGNGLGVWVSSVAAGSVADAAGVEPGDVLTRMQGVTLAQDGTLADYCDVLRTHGQSGVIDGELYRPGEGLYYRGQFSGDAFEPVEVIGASGVAGADDGSSAGAFETVSDDSGAILVEVPAAWSEIDGAPLQTDAGTWASIVAAPSLDGFNGSWNTPGVAIAASAEAVGVIDPQALLQGSADFLLGEGCTSLGRQPFADGYHTGQFEVFDSCGGVGAQYVSLAATSDDGGYVITVNVQANSDDDLAAVDRILGSFIARF